jgi:WD repeat-containing protein 35
MRWSPAGDRICIAYADGAVIMGSADGVRLWGKELGLPLTHVQWSPDGRLILFGTEEGEVHLYDSSGNAAAKLPLQCCEGLQGAPKLAAIEWCARAGARVGWGAGRGTGGAALQPGA